MRALDHTPDPRPAVGFTSTPSLGPGWRPARLTDRYSRRVAILKRLLPVIGVTMLLLVAAWPRLGPLLDSVRFGLPGIDLGAARELKMLDPRYSGIDRYNRPYVVTAAAGRQVPNHNNLMSLEQPRAKLTAHGGAKIELTAATGIYQSQAKLLDLFRRVTLTHQDGTRFTTRQAHLDFSDNTAAGDDPVEGHGPSGDIWGQGFRVLDKGDTIIFTGRSHLVLRGSKPRRVAAAPAALPRTIAGTAAQLAAAAAASPASAGTFSRPAANAPARAEPADHRYLPSGLAVGSAADRARIGGPIERRSGSAAHPQPTAHAAGKPRRHAG